MKGQISAEMLIVLAILLAVASILAVKLLTAARDTGATVDRNVNSTLCEITICKNDADCNVCGAYSRCQDDRTCTKV